MPSKCPVCQKRVYNFKRSIKNYSANQAIERSLLSGQSLPLETIESFTSEDHENVLTTSGVNNNNIVVISDDVISETKIAYLFARCLWHFCNPVLVIQQ